MADNIGRFIQPVSHSDVVKPDALQPVPPADPGAIPPNLPHPGEQPVPVLSTPSPIPPIQPPPELSIPAVIGTQNPPQLSVPAVIGTQNPPPLDIPEVIAFQPPPALSIPSEIAFQPPPVLDIPAVIGTQNPPVLSTPAVIPFDPPPELTLPHHPWNSGDFTTGNPSDADPHDHPGKQALPKFDSTTKLRINNPTDPPSPIRAATNYPLTVPNDGDNAYSDRANATKTPLDIAGARVIAAAVAEVPVQHKDLVAQAEQTSHTPGASSLLNGIKADVQGMLQNISLNEQMDVNIPGIPGMDPIPLPIGVHFDTHGGKLNLGVDLHLRETARNLTRQVITYGKAQASAAVSQGMKAVLGSLTKSTAKPFISSDVPLPVDPNRDISLPVNAPIEAASVPVEPQTTKIPTPYITTEHEDLNDPRTLYLRKSTIALQAKRIVAGIDSDNLRWATSTIHNGRLGNYFTGYNENRTREAIVTQDVNANNSDTNTHFAEQQNGARVSYNKAPMLGVNASSKVSSLGFNPSGVPNLNSQVGGDPRRGTLFADAWITNGDTKIAVNNEAKAATKSDPFGAQVYGFNFKQNPTLGSQPETDKRLRPHNVKGRGRKPESDWRLTQLFLEPGLAAGFSPGYYNQKDDQDLQRAFFSHGTTPNKSLGTLQPEIGISPVEERGFVRITSKEGATQGELDDNEVYVPLVITDMRPIHSNQFRSVYFRPFIKSLTENFTPSWNLESYFGRVDKVATYQNTDRQINLSFQIVCHSAFDIQTAYQKLGWLTSMVYPEYKNTNMYRGPVVRLRVGDVINAKGKDGMRGLPGIITSLNFSYENSTWEINRDSKLPMSIEVTLAFHALHEWPIGLHVATNASEDATEFNAGETMFGAIGPDNTGSIRGFREAFNTDYLNFNGAPLPEAPAAAVEIPQDDQPKFVPTNYTQYTHTRTQESIIAGAKPVNTHTFNDHSLFASERGIDMSRVGIPTSAPVEPKVDPAPATYDAPPPSKFGFYGGGASGQWEDPVLQSHSNQLEKNSALEKAISGAKSTTGGHHVNPVGTFKP